MYDLIIIGGGPAGLTSGLYAARARLDTLLLEKTSLGGAIITTDKIENYPGFPEGIGGYELMQKIESQARLFGLSTESEIIKEIERENNIFKIIGESKTYLAKTLIIASGTTSAKLGIPGEKEYRGKGVSYCATCDALFFKNKPVAVIGGGDAAVEEGIYLTKFANKVYLIHRRDKLRATPILQERAFANHKIEFVFDSIPEYIEGSDYVEKLVFKNIKTGNKKEIQVDGIFLYIGTLPNTVFLKDLLKLDEKGYIITDINMKTEIPGLFAAGDVRAKALRQVSTAVGDGATAAFMAEKYLENDFK
ncbi:MAG: thioredoxin-disulfide reductase [Candidatus Firestonebacteria bacterium]|nr:thioredoxin-disulfide reductase [Candidatus Firestonebacteria bacterium]